MRFFFKHLAIRTWITALMGIPLSFIMIPPLINTIPQASPPVVYGIIICLVFIMAGAGMHFMAQQFIKESIQRAQKWEQAGQVKRCETELIKGLANYNSAFLLPWRKKKTVEKLTGAMARFSLTHDRATPLFINATKHFLKQCPHEAEIAVQWLKKESFFVPNDPASARLLTLLARTQKDNASILPLLVHRFLETHRCDFQARNLYVSCMEAHLLSPSMEQKILSLVPDVFPSITPDGTCHKTPAGLDHDICHFK
jgi:hypothetical protein